MAQIIDPMATLQSYQTANQMNALRAQQMELARMQEARASALQPLQMEAQNLNILAKRMAMDEDRRKRNALMEFGATGNMNALAMADPASFAKMKMMEQRNSMLMNRPRAKKFQIKETPQGLVRIDEETGEVFPLSMGGQPLRGIQTEKPLTEVQGAATGFGLRASKSNEILTGLEDKGVTDTGIIRGAAQRAVGVLPLVGDKLSEAVGSVMNVAPIIGPNSQQQMTEQARRDFVNAILRKESGAVISPSEFENASKQYFPIPGDSKDVIEQKRRNRETAIESLKIQAGPGAAKIPASKPKPTNLTTEEMRELEELRRRFGGGR
jgi:hypothetical protein